MAAPPAPGRFTPKAWAAFAGCTLIWGSTWFVIRTQLGDVPPQGGLAGAHRARRGEQAAVLQSSQK